MSSPKPTRSQGDLAELIEVLLDKGVVINADIAVSVGDTELLGVKLRAALASFETAAEYGLEFPSGTDMERVQKAAGLEEEPSTPKPDGEDMGKVQQAAGLEDEQSTPPTDEEETGQKPTQSE
jgi:hypothetical protein